MDKCIYCESLSPDSVEHHLPYALGNFKGYKTLQNKVCKECNNHIGTVEGPFLKTSTIGLFRKYYSLDGRKRRKKHNPFYTGRSKTPPIETTGIDPWDGKEKRWEIIDKGISQLEALYIYLKDGEKIIIPITPLMLDGNCFFEELEKRNIAIANVERVEIEVSQENLASVNDMLLNTFPKGNMDWKEPRKDIPLAVNTITKIEITQDFYRSVAKIGFHYLLTYSNYFSGGEKEFNDIKDFIYNGCSAINIHKYIRDESEPLLYIMKKGFLYESKGHLVIIEISPQIIIARVQLFVGSQMDDLPPLNPFIINIGKNPLRVICNYSFGHYFQYYNEGKKDGFDGDIQEVRHLYGKL